MDVVGLFVAVDHQGVAVMFEVAEGGKEHGFPPQRSRGTQRGFVGEKKEESPYSLRAPRLIVFE
jgi:hypothetical protein